MTPYRAREHDALIQIALATLADRRATDEDRDEARSRLNSDPEQTELGLRELDNLSSEELLELDRILRVARGQEPSNYRPPQPVVTRVCERCSGISDEDVQTMRELIAEGEHGDE